MLGGESRHKAVCLTITREANQYAGSRQWGLSTANRVLELPAAVLQTRTLCGNPDFDSAKRGLRDQWAVPANYSSREKGAPPQLRETSLCKWPSQHGLGRLCKS